MHVVATAGHVDHGKSLLVRALTGMDPDRLAAEHERGLSIELGHCSTTLDPIGDVAFVDVPGHERFISTMLAGIGPVPAVLFVVAADDPWMPQAAEHLAALNALKVTQGVLAITRCDLADPSFAREQALAALKGTSLERIPTVSVSARTGEGLNELRAKLVAMLSSARPPDPDSDVRLWIDRCFTLRSSGTIVTGTLQAGKITTGDSLESGEGMVRVREMQALGKPIQSMRGPARVALNISSDRHVELERGSVLVTPNAWHFSQVFDVRLRTGTAGASTSDTKRMPRQPILHIGAAAIPAHYRALSVNLGRVSLDRPIPLHVGDRALLHDPGSRTVWGITVLDPEPPPLKHRGAATQRVHVLTTADGCPDVRDEIVRREIVSRTFLRHIGVPAQDFEQYALSTSDWILDKQRATVINERAERLVRTHNSENPLDPGMPIKAIANALGLPSVDLVIIAVREPMRIVQGRLHVDEPAPLPAQVMVALAELERDFQQNPFAAPTADRLLQLGLDKKSLAAAARAHLILQIAPGIVLQHGADRMALDLLRELPQPFTASDVRTKLNTTRRSAVPLLEYLDKLKHTSRLPDDRRTMK